MRKIEFNLQIITIKSVYYTNKKNSLELSSTEIKEKLQDLERELSKTENFESKLEESTKKTKL